MRKNHISAISRIFTCCVLFIAPFNVYAEGATITGENQYRNYCAVCHGRDGLGDGPLAKYLVTPPRNLTVLSRENGGSFPETMIHQIVDGRSIKGSHGTKEMPIWGERFGKEGMSEESVDRKISNIIHYIEQLQK